MHYERARHAADDGGLELAPHDVATSILRSRHLPRNTNSSSRVKSLSALAKIKSQIRYAATFPFALNEPRIAQAGGRREHCATRNHDRLGVAIFGLNSDGWRIQTVLHFDSIIP
jgi:hypothetical protein